MRQAKIAALRAGDLRVFPEAEYGDAILRNPTQYSLVIDGTLAAGGVVCIFVRDDAESQTKTGLQRIVPVADKLLPVIQRRLDAANGGHLFPFAVADKGASFGRDWREPGRKG